MFPYTFPLTFEDHYVVKIDWDGDGLFIPANEDVSHRVRAQPGISIKRGKDQIRALAPPMAGSIDFELDNRSKDYSAEYAASPLAGSLLTGRAVRVQAAFGATLYHLAKGQINDLPQYPERQRRSVGVQCLGSMAKLKDSKVSSPLYQTIRTDQALGYLLDAAGWPAGARVLDTGNTVLGWYWLDDEDAFSAAVALMNTEGPGAALYEDGQGRIVFESRYYRVLTIRSNTSQATIRDSGAEPLFAPPFGYDTGRQNIVNECQITTKVRTAAAGYSDVWTFGTTLTLTANEVIAILVATSDPFTDALVPVVTTDYTVASGSVASMALSRTSGSRTTLTVTAGASGCELTGLKMRAKTVAVSYTRVAKNTVDTSVSQGRYGLRSYSLAIRPEISYQVALDFCNAIVGWYNEPSPTVAVSLNWGHADRLTQMLSREISDRVTLVEAQTGMNADVWIEQIKHRIEGGSKHRAVLGCGKVSAAQYFILGTSTLDSMAVLGY